MNLRRRGIVLTVRIILGAFFAFSGITGFLAGMSGMEGVPAPMALALRQLWNMGIFQMIKITELVAGIMLVFGIFPALALLFLAPICIGIIVFNAFVAPAYIVSGVIVSVLTIYLAYVHWDKYRAIFQK